MQLIDKEDSDWMRRAACRGLDPDLFYIKPGESEKPAQEVCSNCPVEEQCLASGMQEQFGIWGGVTTQGRRRVKRSA